MAANTRPILCAATQPGALPALKALLAGGANTELADEKGFTALAAAAWQGELPLLQLLLDAGANANTQDLVGSTPLMQAIGGNRVECARLAAGWLHTAHVCRVRIPHQRGAERAAFWQRSAASSWLDVRPLRQDGRRDTEWPESVP